MAKRKNSSRRRPSHPGELLFDVLEDSNVEAIDFARKTGIPLEQVHRLGRCSTPVTSDIANKLGAYFGDGPAVWLRMQAAYDDWQGEPEGEKSPPINAIHPGEILREEYLKPLSLSADDIANAINQPAEVIVAILNEKAEITPAIASGLSSFFKTSAGFWLNLQTKYDEDADL